MRERQEFISFINRLKTLSPTITEEQYKGLLQQAVQQSGLAADEADELLKTSGLIVGEGVDYFDVLGLPIEELENSSEVIITESVEAAHKKLYSASLRAGGRPRSDGSTEEQWRTLLNQARDTLTDPEKRLLYLSTLLSEEIPIVDESNPSGIDEMVFIPEGEFQSVYVDGFYIDKYPVTNTQYKLFLNASPQWQIPNLFNSLKMGNYRDNDYLKNWFRNNYPHGKDEHPVTWVSWYAAMAYAQWIGKRLPTETEWEKAARGGLTGLKYPWGNSTDITKANFDISVGETTPVGQYPANKYGLYDVVGNVFEWCLDAWNSKFYNSSDSHNPISDESIESIIDKPTKSKGERVLRGGSWHSPANDVRIANRDYLVPRKTKSTIGFRCVKEISSQTGDNRVHL